MNAADQAHLAAMGLLPPSTTVPALPVPAPPVPLRQAILDRASALRVHTLNISPAEYGRRHRGMTRIQRQRFTRARHQHKLMQRYQNSLAGDYTQRVRALVHNAPNPGRNPVVHLQWLPGFLGNGGVTLLKREELANLAQEIAVYAIEQAEKHNGLLRRWQVGYNTHQSRLQHEGYTQLAASAATN